MQAAVSHYCRGVLVKYVRRRSRFAALLGVIALFVGACSSGETTQVVSDASQAQDTSTTLSAPTTTTPTTTSTPTTTTTEAPTTTTSTTIQPVRTAEECAAEIALEFRLGQLLFPVMTQDEFATANDLASRGHIGGIVVLGSPDATISEDIETLQAQALVDGVIVAVDEEGGRVQRLESLIGAQPSAREVAATEDAQTARTRATRHGFNLAELGFTMNLAPVADLDTGVFVGDRSYGADPAVVTDYVLAVADGIIDAGLSPVVKHFPGHGAGTDSHIGLPTIPPVDELRSADLVPFQRAADRGDLPIMIGHLVIPGLTDGRPATLSAAAVQGLLRTEMGFDGLVMTDALNMDAISDTTTNADAAEQALAAGVDLIMMGSLQEVPGTIEQLLDAVASGRLSEDRVNESFLRVFEHRELEICSLPEDLRSAVSCETESSSCS